MLPRIDRYLIKEILLTFSATVLVLLAMVLSHRLAGYLGKAASGLLSKDVIFLLLGLQAIRFMVVLVPLAFLLSSMLTLGRLYRDNEMTALTACGVGPGTLYRPLFLMAIPMAIGLSILSLYLVPLCMDLQFQLQSRARQDAQVSMFTPGTFREVSGGQYVIYVGALAKGGHELRHIFIRSVDKNGFAITTGQQGYQEIDPNTGARYIVLIDGHRYQGTPGQNDFERLHFERLAVHVDTDPSEQTWRPREAYPTAQLWNSDNPVLISELQERFSGPISLLLLAFVIPLLARANPREGRYGRLVAGILVYTIYINLIGLGQSWLARGNIDSSLGLWWVHGLLLLSGLALWIYHYGMSFRPFFRREPNVNVNAPIQESPLKKTSNSS